jgi:hypothetical protein
MMAKTVFEAQAVFEDVAGLSLAAPRSKYAIGAARWQRDPPFGLLMTGSLTLDLDPRTARELGSPVTRAVFSPLRWLNAGWPGGVGGYLGRDVMAGSESWRALIVEHRLLSRPELIRSESARKAWETASGAGEAERAALRALAERYHRVLSSYTTGRPRVVIECAACQAAREQRGAASVPRHLRTIYPGREQRASCVHAPMAVNALEQLCEAHPELTFEIIGWFAPEGALSRSQDASSPRRFVLDTGVMKAVYGHWLLGQAPEEWGSWRYHGYRQHERKSFRVDRRRLTNQPDKVAKKLRGALAFAAASWGIASAPEELVIEADAESSPLPVLGERKPPRLATPRVLPDAAPRLERAAAPAPRKSRARSRRGTTG